MESRHKIAGTPEVKLAVRVRGLSHEERYFDEQTSTTRVTQEFIVIRLPKLVDLDFELHVTNMRTQVGGIYRVAWINTRPEQGLYSIGLELLDADGEIWEPGSIPDVRETGDVAPVVSLECQRCYQTISTSLHEVETASLGEGLTIALPCDTCKSTTSWAYVVEEPIAADAPLKAGGAAGAKASANGPAHQSAESLKDLRQKGRAPIHLAIKITRTKYGLPIFDICETINVSRTGVYFTTEQGYEVGETLEVILPYHPDSMAIPFQGRVVRQDRYPGTLRKRVAIQLIPGPTTKQ
ncbi:MAG: PilZ domain-containing protein [Terriglobia bacterium]|jgi:hypothetical protein